MANGVEYESRRAVAAWAPRGPVDAVRAAVTQPRWALYLALVVFNVADVFTTAWVLDRGGAERNPLVQPIAHELWQVGVLKALVLACVAALLVRIRTSRLAELALAATTGWYLAVVAWNLVVLARV